MTIKHYEDIDYSVMVPEDIYLKFVEEARRMAIYGENGKSALKHEIERAYFRYTHFGRMDMEWKQKADNGELAEHDFLCGQWFIGDTQEHLNVLYDCLKTVNAEPHKYKTAEEFFFEWDKENFIR